MTGGDSPSVIIYDVEGHQVAYLLPPAGGGAFSVSGLLDGDYFLRAGSDGYINQAYGGLPCYAVGVDQCALQVAVPVNGNWPLWRIWYY